MEPNVLDQLRDALQQLNALLDQQPVKTAIGLIPDSIMNPVIEGLKTILNVVKDALDQLKESLDSVGNISELLGAINSLLEAAEGLATSQRDTLEGLRSVVRTLQDLPGAAEIDAILQQINQIVTKLEAL
jgi:conjugal transfer/entry exclusion protein